MSDIAKLYDEVMAGVEKTASDTSAQGGQAFDRNFFEKVASGDDDAVETMNAFIEEARAEGYDDGAIESAVAAAMSDSGMSDEEIYGDDAQGDDDYESEKVAMYHGGCQQAIEDVLEKAASYGIGPENFAEYDMGVAYGEGYGVTRQEMEEALFKIASATGATAEKAPGALKKFFNRYVELAAGGKGAKGAKERILGAGDWKEKAMVHGTRAATGLGAGGIGYGGYRLATRGQKKGRR